MRTNKYLNLVNNKPFPTIESASKYLQVSRSTVVSILDMNVAMSTGFYCFSNSLTPELKVSLLSNFIVRDPISSLRIESWVYDYNLNLVNDKPFNSQLEMLKFLGLKRIRTIKKYKDKGIFF